MRIAFVSSPYLGWGSIRKRWEKAFAGDDEVDFLPLHWDEMARPWRQLYERTGRLQSLWFGLAGREAALRAIRGGYQRILLTTVAQAGLLPKRPGVRYFVYGDSTAKQLQELYGRRASPKLEQLAYRGLTRDRSDLHFLCMSRWYESALRKEYGIPEARTSILPSAVDTDLWVPATEKAKRPVVLFIGGDFVRKGGPLLREVAASMPETEFMYVTKESGEPGPNETFRSGLKPDSPELVATMQSASLFVIPSTADCSSHVSVEAGSCGIPVVASAVGGIPEVVLDGQTGTIIKEHKPDAYRAAIELYMSDPDLRAERGRRGRENALANHTLSGQMSQLKKLLAE